MFNFDGQLVADAVFIQRMGDTLQGIRDRRAAVKVEEMQQVLLFANKQRYALLVTKYNDLVDRYNGIIADNKRMDAAYSEVIAEKDRQISQLIEEKAELAAESEESRLSAQEGWDKHHDALVEIERLKIKAGELPPDET